MALGEELHDSNQRQAEIMYKLAKHIHQHTRDILHGGSSGISQGPSEVNQAGPLYGVRSGIERTPSEEQQTAGIDLGLWFDDLVSECDEGYIPDHDRHTCSKFSDGNNDVNLFLYHTSFDSKLQC